MMKRNGKVAGRVLTGVLGLTMAWALGGCSVYQLHGKAINGTEPGVLVVSADDPRLEQPGLMGAIVKVTLDPDRLSAKEVGGDVADADGEFTVPVDEFGAGVLEFDVRVTARLAGHRPTVETVRLPGLNQRLLIIMAPGQDTGPPVGEDVLDETLRYLGR